MGGILAAAGVIIGILNFAAAIAGAIYVVGVLPGLILVAVLLFFGITFWVAPAAFVGAMFYWELAWYWAALIALPGLGVYLAVMTGVMGGAMLDRFRRR